MKKRDFLAGMLNKKAIFVLSSLAFIWTCAYAQDWKDNWRNSPLNWRNSQLRYKKTINRYKTSSVSREVREWVISDREAIDASIPEEQKAHVTPQIETINGEAETITAKATQDEGHTDNYFIVYSGKHVFRVEKNLQPGFTWRLAG